MILFTTQCANYKSVENVQEIDKKYYSSIGFALIYDDSLLDQGILNRKIDNNEIIVLHSFLKRTIQLIIIKSNRSNCNPNGNEG